VFTLKLAAGLCRTAAVTGNQSNSPHAEFYVDQSGDVLSRAAIIIGQILTRAAVCNCILGFDLGFDFEHKSKQELFGQKPFWNCDGVWSPAISPLVAKAWCFSTSVWQPVSQDMLGGQLQIQFGGGVMPVVESAGDADLMEVIQIHPVNF